MPMIKFEAIFQRKTDYEDHDCLFTNHTSIYHCVPLSLFNLTFTFIYSLGEDHLFSIAAVFMRNFGIGIYIQ